jgi:competence protein ComEC
MLTVKSPSNWQAIAGSNAGAGALKPIFLAKRGLTEAGDRALGHQLGGVLNAILIGSKTELTYTERQQFEKTGTMHLLATAGLHTGVVVAMLLFLLRFCRLPKRASVIATLIGLLVFTIMSGDRPAVVRAAVMAAVYLAGLALEREPDLTNSISIAALVLLIANPFNLFEIGFQITFATVITLALGMPFAYRVDSLLTARERRLRGPRRFGYSVLRYFAACLGVTLLAQLGSTPLVVYYFNMFAPAGLLANLLIVPIIAPLMLLGFTGACVSALSPAAAAPVYFLLKGLTAYILMVVRICSGPAFGAGAMASPPAFAVALYYLLIWCGLLWLSRSLQATESDHP